MKTQYYNAVTQKENGTKLAGQVLRAGGLVAFPTETVYGLGADGLNEEAVLRIFEAKGRPGDNPLILHVARKSDAKDLWTRVPEKARQLMDAFWPGPLTLVYDRAACVPDAVTAGLGTVAVRMPSHKTALALLRAAGVPVAAPSANLSGKPSPTTAAHVKRDLDGKIDVILDGGPCEVGVESTVLSLLGQPTILRPGGITREMIEAVIGAVALSPAILSPLKEGEAAASPGMKYKHYAPQAEVRIAPPGSPRAIASSICAAYDVAGRAGKRCVIFATEQTRGFYCNREYAIIGDRKNPSTLCANLFAALRSYDDGAADLILCEPLDESDMGLAYMNRLLRAAGFAVLQPGVPL
ncbi:MAG: threonylcarbamoyl-AMP synthase [Christensenellaceae bacterium]|jgi:L-threonylcarbamoyladenylate synthase|nr:threonylcarbamoyl-AMP synthase [Christensenellaceae bacterium]